MITPSPVEEHAVADGALVSAVARDPGLEAHLVLIQVDGDGVHGGGRHRTYRVTDRLRSRG